MEYIATPMNAWVLWPSFAIILATFISWIFFGRRMARIERAIRGDGKPRPCPWDGPGARIVWYAWAIALPVGRWNPLDDPFIEVQVVRDYANDLDRIAAIMMVISTGLTVLVTILGSIFV